MFWIDNKWEYFGKLAVSGEIEATKKPAGLVVLKSLGVALILFVGVAVILPIIPLPAAFSVTITCVVLFLYVIASHFLRPQANMEQIGWFGGLMDNVFSIADDWNRLLLVLNYLLGPGRFVAGTVVDLCMLAGIDLTYRPQPKQTPMNEIQETLKNSQNRNWGPEARDRSRCGGEVELDSMKYFNSDQQSREYY